MEFAICPGCKQSVLDDDAVNCPFCGAAMKGKPGAVKPAASKPASSKPAAPAMAATPTKAAGAVPPRPIRPSAGPMSADIMPFDMGEDFGPAATPLSASLSKSRTMEVKCPMCETVGFASPDAAGQSVKCVNPKCQLPVFTAPRRQVERKVEPPPPKPKQNLPLVAGVTLALMAAGGGIAWFVASRPQETTFKAPSAEDLELIKQSNPSPMNPGTAAKSADPNEKDGADEKVAVKAPAEPSFGPILKILNDASLQQGQNRSKPFCRRLSAEANALAGDLAGAQQQLDALAKVGRDVPFYRVMPLVQIAWQQLAGGQKKAAAKTIEEAWQASAKLPATGRDRLDAAMSLAAILIAANRVGDAQKLLETHDESDAIAQLARQIRTVQAVGTFNLAEMDARKPALPWNAPLKIGVIFELTGHGQSEAGRKWADQLPDARDRAEALGAWAEAVVWTTNLRGGTIPVDELRSAVEALPVPGNVLALSRLGLGLSLAGQEAAASDCLTKAREALATWSPKTDVVLPEDYKELSRFKPPDFEAGMYEVEAVAEAALLASRIGQTTSAEELLTSALARARALAPSPRDVQRRIQETKAGGLNALRERLKQEWKLKTNNEAVVAATSLQKNLDELRDAAQRRVDVQSRLLARAVDQGLADSVWAYIRRGSTRDDAAEADNLIFTNLPSLIAEHYRAADNKERYDLVTAAWKQLSPDRALARPIKVQLAEALAQGDTARASQLIQQLKSDPAEQDEAALRAACQESASGRLDSALTFASRLADPVLKEECYLLIGAIAGRSGEWAAVEQHFAELAQASEKVSLGRGLIAGWVSGKQPGKPAPAE